MNNSYFRIALSRARAVLGNKGRLLTLVVQLIGKLNTSNISSEYWKGRLFLTGRLIKAFATGKYRDISIKSILLLIAAVIYFINPLDLIPDAVIGFGFTDDLAILTGVYSLVSGELEKFQEWEFSIYKS